MQITERLCELCMDKNFKTEDAHILIKVKLNEIMKSKDTTFYIRLSHEENSLRKNIREKRLSRNCQTYLAV